MLDRSTFNSTHTVFGAALSVFLANYVNDSEINFVFTAIVLVSIATTAILCQIAYHFNSIGMDCLKIYIVFFIMILGNVVGFSNEIVVDQGGKFALTINDQVVIINITFIIWMVFSIVIGRLIKTVDAS